MGINRNIVECKFRCHITSLNPFAVLIETLWNVNPANTRPSSILVSVLIETLWNVNFIRCQRTTQGIQVLIETLWNVNAEPIMLFLISLICINRNIVECKWNMKQDGICDAAVVLIETLWNVNHHQSAVSEPLTYRINRNIVECK